MNKVLYKFCVEASGSRELMIANPTWGSNSGEGMCTWLNPHAEIQNKLTTRGKVKLIYRSSTSLSLLLQTDGHLFAFIRRFLPQAMARLTLLIYRGSLQNLPCIWTTVVACALKRHQITCIWGNYSVFFSGQSPSGKVQKLLRDPVGNCSVGLAMQRAAPMCVV